MLCKLKIVPVSEKQIKAGHVPKYTIMIKEIDYVGNYVKFISQEKELINALNVEFEGKVFDFSRKKNGKSKKISCEQTTIDDLIN